MTPARDSIILVVVNIDRIANEFVIDGGRLSFAQGGGSYQFTIDRDLATPAGALIIDWTEFSRPFSVSGWAAGPICLATRGPLGVSRIFHAFCSGFHRYRTQISP